MLILKAISGLKEDFSLINSDRAFLLIPSNCAVLFEYLISQKSTGQIIVVENDKNVPSDIDFEALGVNVIDFHKDNYKSRFKNNRYGFLIGVTGK